MTSLRFYGGVEGEIGGNQILLQDGETRILLDLGVNFSRWRRYFSFPLSRPRGMEDYFRVGLIPEALREPGEAYIRRDLDACIITHPHSDHYGAACALPPDDVPVYLGEAAYRIISAKMEGRRGPEAKAFSQLEFRTFRTGTRISIGDVEVVPWHVDHSTPGSYVLLVYTSGGLVVYTGDFRVHGSFGQRLTEERGQFWHRLEGEEVKAFICEGTNIGEPVSPLSERDVEHFMQECVEECRGLAIVNTSTCDVDRLKTVCQVAERTNRRVVATKHFLVVLEALKDDEKLAAPKVGVDVLPYEDELDELKAHQPDYMLLTSFYRGKEILEVEPIPGSCFILSSSEPFEEEGEIEFTRLKNWLHLFGVPIYHVHTSGHALPMHLLQVVEKLSPATVYPVHTEAPEAFCRLVGGVLGEGRVIPPERGVVYEV